MAKELAERLIIEKKTIAEAEDLADEKEATMKRWSKRETQLNTLLDSTAGIYGDLQGIAGRDLAEIDALGDMLLLESEV